MAPVAAAEAATRGSAYAELSQQIKAVGLLDRRRGYYAVKITLNLVVLAGLWLLVVWLGSSWWQLGVAALLGLVAGQLAFIGHDAGHRQIGRRRWSNDLIGLLHANLISGLSYEWWVGKHNRHHANPNHVEKDPDVGVGALVFTAEQAVDRSGFARWLTRSQAHLFFPMTLFEGLVLHWQSVDAFFRKPGVRGQIRGRILEIGLFAIHLAAYATILLLVMSPLQALAFFGVHKAVWGLYMGCSFAPNHKGMPAVTDEDELDFLSKQVLTSRNIKGSWITDFALGGLNYQIDHHLFPSMPRPNLRLAQPIIRRFCAERGVDYCEDSVVGSYTEVLRHLYAVGAPLRAKADAAST